MKNNVDRRAFLKTSLAGATGATMTFGFEERILLAKSKDDSSAPEPAIMPSSMPAGKIKNLSISRLICGGNLISGHAHSRDLLYVSALLKNYFTDDRVMETLQKCESNGINTAILRLDEHTLRILKRYRKERNGRIQWIAQIKPTKNDLTTDADAAIDNGALGVYIQGETGDRFFREGMVEQLGVVVEHIKKRGAVAGIGAHMIDVVIASEKAGLQPDFYMKTFNSKSYWSAGPAERHDSVWEETPQQTLEFMKTVEKPWIAFKVLGAGAIPPEEGFTYAFENGADFICVGMFDFQVAQDANIACKTLNALLDRDRPWRA
ncbi:MAG TPA: hypothetical protein PLI09_14265 [Candidatus Hydrogenedentes bacterium]|nr:hypothetical protein [Candidatus Hydrogenedentota bacterium]